MRPDPTDPTRIEISLGVKQGTPLNTKSVAALGSISLMSNPVVSITTGANDAPRLAASAVIPSQESISIDEMERKVAALSDSAQNTLTSLQADVNNVTGDARHLLGNLNTVTGKANQRHVTAILSNADTTVGQLSSKTGPTMDNVNATVTNANTTITNANGTITALREPMQADLVELRRTLEETHQLVGNVDLLLRTNRQNITYTFQNIRMAY